MIYRLGINPTYSVTDYHPSVLSIPIVGKHTHSQKWHVYRISQFIGVHCVVLRRLMFRSYSIFFRHLDIQVGSLQAVLSASSADLLEPRMI